MINISKIKIDKIYDLMKVIRYLFRYGPFRTLAKIKGTLHLNFSSNYEGDVWYNKNCKSPHSNFNSRSVAIIGAGYFSYTVIAYFLSCYNKKILRAVLDIDMSRSISLCRDYSGLYATNQLDKILLDPEIKLIYIASNHASHADYAVKCIKAGKHVHIEKPHVISFEQLKALELAMIENKNSKVFLGFNRPRSPVFQKINSLIKAQSGPSMLNWFVVGHHLEDNHWYYNEKEGGRVLGNLCHWSDLILHTVGVDKVFPCTINPTKISESKSDYVVSILFKDASSAVITFSAKGKTSTGVREVLNLQKKDCVILMEDFDRLYVDHGNGIKNHKWFIRDHGHRANILNSYINSIELNGKGEKLTYIKNTALLYLYLRNAIMSGKVLKVNSNDLP
ncbi:Gfo/Idh/MocA family oxidoreductase [Alphaproteobacteria bacterium]|nr:Gfo/Idh/MocA family oxidoreductase [Alphaproteobacteria bacterium]